MAISEYSDHLCEYNVALYSLEELLVKMDLN